MFIPVVLFLFNNNDVFKNMRFTTQFIYASQAEYGNFFYVVFLSYLIMISVYFFNRVLRKQFGEMIVKKKFSENIEKIIYNYGCFFFIVGGGSVILFFYSMGGIREALEAADALRYAGTDSSQYYGPLTAIFRMLSFLVMGAAYCFKSHYDLTKSNLSRILFIISFGLASIYLIFNSGRSTIIFFLFPFILSYAKKRNINLIFISCVVVIVAISTAQVFDVILYQISHGGINTAHINSSIWDNINSAINDFSFPSANIINIEKMNSIFGLRNGKDYIIWILDIIPTRAFNMLGITLPDYQTLNFETSNYFQSINPLLMGGVPTDFITTGLRQHEMLGLIINTLVYALFALRVDKLVRSFDLNLTVIFARLQILFFSFISNNDLTDIVRGNLFIFIMLIMLVQIDLYSNKVNRSNHSIE
ncbi:O-antigen polymerase [Vaginisenegalia massiliensis]|uniref:O-antigen polymerase n=1 Tax=Vaginisenegalia massiliensis TaxID=2058294 RepID=UPI0013DE3CEE|nr:O-antigen polymerase [Vaginisenegalia massiliensis]